MYGVLSEGGGGFLDPTKDGPQNVVLVILLRYFGLAILGSYPLYASVSNIKAC